MTAMVQRDAEGLRLVHASIRQEGDPDLYKWDVCIYPDDVNPAIDSFGTDSFEDAIAGAVELVTKYRSGELEPS